MAQHSYIWSVGVFCLVAAGPAIAQIVPDATLPNNSIVTHTGKTSIITGGTLAGKNLFHSFEQFSVPTGNTAYFNNALEMQNILTRVTGSSVSNIDGLIKANGTANFFLLNPNGVLFGPNAQLNVGGSFLASTASRLSFGDGTVFNAASTTKPLLTVSVPVGLGFGGTPGDVRVQGANLTVRTGKTLALVGGDVSLAGGRVAAPSGRVELGSLQAGSVSLNPTTKGWSLGYDGGQFRDVQLSQAATVDVSGVGGGDIEVQARSLQLSEGSKLVALTLGAASGGNISVNASKSVELIGTGTFASDTLRFAAGTVGPSNLRNGLFTVSFGSGAAGNVVINTPNFVARDGAFVATSAIGPGRGGDLTLNASDSVNLTASALLTGSGVGNAGNAGDLTINTRQLTAQDNGFVGTSSLGSGRGGSLTVNASDSVQLIGSNPIMVTPTLDFFTGLFSSSKDGQTGDLRVTTGRLDVQDGAAISANTYGRGQGGNVTVIASQSVNLSGASPNGQAQSALTAGNWFDSTGRGGNLTVQTGQLNLLDSGRLSVRSRGTGDAGNIHVVADSIELDHLGSIAAATTTAGNGGNIQLQTQNLQLRHNSIVSATAGTTGGGGNGGNITIDSGTLTVLENSDIVANAYQGLGGKIHIDTQGLFLAPNSQITASSIRGINGIVDINTPLNNLQTALTPLEGELVSTEQVVADSCVARRNVEQGSFTVTGNGGLPPTPYEAMSSRYAVVGVQPIEKGLRGLGEQFSSNASLSEAPLSEALLPSPAHHWQLGDPIQEAQGLNVTADGHILLGNTRQQSAVIEAKNLVCHPN